MSRFHWRGICFCLERTQSSNNFG